MKKLYISICYLWSLLGCSLALAQTPVELHGALSVEGVNIVNKDGKTVSFAGPSLFWSNTGWGGEDYYKSEVVSWVRSDWDATIIRAAMGVDDQGGYLTNPENKNKVKTVVDAAINEGMYVLIDWHSHHAQFYQDEAVAFFTEMAQTYGDKENVIYEIYNEPLQVSWSGTIKPYAEAVIAAIRAVDPDNLIIVGTPNWSQDVDVASKDPIVDYDNIAYTLHFYAGTHMQDLRNKAITAMNNGVALMVTEWGTVEANGDGAVAGKNLDQWIQFMKFHQLTNCNWALNDKKEGASALVDGASIGGNWTSDDLTASGLVVKELILNWDELENFEGVTKIESYEKDEMTVSKKVCK